VAALRADQLQEHAQKEAAAEAHRHLSLADKYSSSWLRPLVIAVGGIAGTGKTTLATTLAEALGAELLRTDVVRQDLFGAGPHTADVDGGIYHGDARERVYDELFRRAAALHDERLSIVLDGTFSKVDFLSRARRLATDLQSVFVAIECACRPEVAHERISQRLAAGRDASEARPEIHDIQQMRWEMWPAYIPQIRIDTEQPVSKQVEQAIRGLTRLVN
jgi:predicted kinase